MNLYFVGAASADDHGLGQSVPISRLLSQPDGALYRYVDNCFVNDYLISEISRRSSATPEHEILHLFMGIGGHSADPKNILHGGGGFNEVTGRRRISESQEVEIYAHPAVEEVER